VYKHIKTFTISSLTINTNFKLHIFPIKFSIIASHLNVSMYIQLYSLSTHYTVPILLTVNITRNGTKWHEIYIFNIPLLLILSVTQFFAHGFAKHILLNLLLLQTSNAVLALGTLLIFAVLTGKCVLPSLSCVNGTDRNLFSAPALRKIN
jgi:hypothetical protein